MERITLLSIAIFLFASITKAQITKGSVYLGGSIGASSAKSDNSNSSVEGKSSWFSINPAVGTAIKNNLIAGINLNYEHGKTENFNGNQNNKNNSYGGGFFLRKYYPLSNRIYVFGESGLRYFYQKWEYLQTPGYNYTSVNKQNFVSVNLFPGLAIHVTKSFYLETTFNNLIQIGYSNSKSTSNYLGSITTSKQNGVSIQSSLNNGSYLNIGVRFIIPKK
jgi:hypothetical protein